MLGRQDYTEKKLSEKMSKRFPESRVMIEEIIESMKEFDYLNDKRFIERLVSSSIESGQVGPALLRNKLYVKGFSSQDIDTAMQSEEVGEADFYSDALRMKVKYFGDAPIADPKLRNRAMGKLVRKGFSFSDSNRALSYDPEKDD
jgi:regulatory protein